MDPKFIDRMADLFRKEHEISNLDLSDESLDAEQEALEAEAELENDEY